MKTMVDNVATQILEAVLIADLDDLFSPAHVMHLEAKAVQSIAEESLENAAYRELLEKRLRVLEAGADTCTRHSRRKAIRR